MKIISLSGTEDIAIVYLAQTDSGHFVECVESLQPPIPREKKWVLIVSTLLGCPIGCPICDAGSWYKGGLSIEDILGQIDYMVKKRFPNRSVPVEKFKIQFARMGEPSFNPAVIEVLHRIPKMYNAPGLMPCISTVAPESSENFFSALLEAKNTYYLGGNFQLQFSIHTTDVQLRDKLIPIKKWDFKRIALYGKQFRLSGDRKVTLNFALAKDSILDANILKRYFDPDVFLIKITPVNPTENTAKNNIHSYFIDRIEDDPLHIVEQLKASGFEVLVSLGELEENKIGSNCGQYLRKYLNQTS